MYIADLDEGRGEDTSASTSSTVPNLPAAHLIKQDGDLTSKIGDLTTTRNSTGPHRGLRTFWSRYQSGGVMCYQGRNDSDPNWVQVSDYIQHKPPWPWQMILVETQCDDKHFYVISFQNHDTQAVQEDFPPGYVFVRHSGFHTQREALELCQSDPEGRLRVIPPNAFADEKILIDIKGRETGYLLSYQSLDVLSAEQHWNRLAEVDKEAMHVLASFFYDLDTTGVDQIQLDTGNHALEHPTAHQRRWRPRDAVHKLPIGWHAWVRYEDGQVIYLHQESLTVHVRHPVNHFCTEGLLDDWELRWKKMGSEWRVFFANHSDRSCSWNYPPGFLFVAGKGFVPEFEAQRLQAEGHLVCGGPRAGYIRCVRKEGAWQITWDGL
ncbi:hypothetical protein CAC42_3501 [Sphaceloma murrayae]|uniref:WW domain-containing protein n=1 Tax=Sphaceloma murrayae TaxID=2082308 RepID=A0A2K1R1V3_9PEZI|nr:hypothetical protein CAC42_3501 [Sphaceloma murrayae]